MPQTAGAPQPFKEIDHGSEEVAVPPQIQRVPQRDRKARPSEGD